jgi:hypothetical protein
MEFLIVLGLLVALPVVLLALLFLLMLTHTLYRGCVSLVLQWRVWAMHRAWVVWVYLDSPKWKDYVESEILPALPAGSAVINRSAPWQPDSLAGRVYRHFGGEYEFCPIGIVFRRGEWVTCFRFFQPFQKAKRGDRSSLDAMRADFVAALSDISECAEASQR